MSLALPKIVKADQLTKAVLESEKRPQARLLKRDQFIDRRDITALRLSPKGDRLAFVTPKGKHSSLWVHHVESGLNSHLFTSEIMNNIYWSSDGDYIIMSTDRGVAAAKITQASFPEFLLKLDPAVGDVFHGVDPSSPHHIFVSLYNEKEDDFSLYRVDMKGQKELLYRGENKLNNFVTEPLGPMKFLIKTEGLTQTITHREGNVDEALVTCVYGENCVIAHYSKETDQLYYFGRDQHDKQGLLKLDMHTKAISRIHWDPENRFDIDEAFFSRRTGKPLLVGYDTDYRNTYAVDTEIEQDVSFIKQSLNSKVLYFKPTSDSHWLIINSPPESAQPKIFLYDRKTRKLWEPLKEFIAENPVKSDPIKDEDLALRIAFWYPASDGFKVQGYLTLPRGVEIAKAPMVVFPHGGPWNRVYGGFAGVPQLLANRGYIVFEPNFRASTGFGKAYIMSAQKDFGDGRVQDDIIDGVSYLLGRGIGDDKKLAIFGHSFGGFSTMAALAFQPEMFQVGIAGAPPPSLSKAVKFLVKNQEKTSIGVLRKDIMAELAVNIDVEADVQRLYDQSPDKNFFKVKRPLYIVAGEKDRRVNILDVRDYALRVEANGTTIGMLTDKKERHNFKKKTAREAYFYLIEKVLAHHLKGRYEEVGSKKLQKYLTKNMVMGAIP
ncbi:prolyl oligopeptidase family serine peptidase [Temperatibacter marinus]|uniref:Prolyl oligopeptidase family serine peptidase n=1 Tax=Temperatibacter marinus TaxID=1456591 RepID=A0AA52EFU4_9PROT|nr:prolyl oligopeptidase family serine peptidase [Temperatibacter marinus]WND01744.1 prolyl oligopeptidase family serine peptidase [Temperatibacter marinus]